MPKQVSCYKTAVKESNCRFALFTFIARYTFAFISSFRFPITLHNFTDCRVILVFDTGRLNLEDFRKKVNHELFL